MTYLMDKFIFFFDEPTFGQDQSSIDLIIELIKYLKLKKKIQFIISHDEKFIKSIATKVYCLENLNLIDVTKDYHHG